MRQRAAYDVGCAKPPQATRFKAGSSGNPRGRPKGSEPKDVPALSNERLSAIILEEAYRMVDIQEHDKQRSIPIAQAIVRSLIVRAAKR